MRHVANVVVTVSMQQYYKKYEYCIDFKEYKLHFYLNVKIPLSETAIEVISL